MRSGPAFLDLREAATWICQQLTDQPQGSGCYEEVLRVLHMETEFMAVVGLLKERRPRHWERGYVYRRGCWVRDPSIGDEE